MPTEVNRPSGVISRFEIVETLLTCRDHAMNASCPKEAANIMDVATQLLKRAWSEGILPHGRVPFPMQTDNRRHMPDLTNVVAFPQPTKPSPVLGDLIGGWGRPQAVALRA